VLLLRYGVGDDNRLKAGVVDARNRRPRKNAVREDGVRLGRPSVHQSAKKNQA